MQQIADFHIHSRFSRACSRDLTIKNLDQAGRVKGVQIIGTGDFTHPEWLREMERDLVATRPDSGLYRHREGIDDKIKFILTAEVALIYKDYHGLEKPKVRRIHLVIHGPSIEAVGGLNTILGKRFNLRSDGRPILGISAPDFVKLVLDVNPSFLIYPAHIWTPWFSVFGSKSGFNNFEECFREQSSNIFAYETGLSSDPGLNWRVPVLDNLTLLSNSDAHSLGNIGREANILDLEDFTYEEIYQAIKKRDLKKLQGTIEFYPEEGMYHFDGHRDCSIAFAPSDFAKHQGICPSCNKPLTIGVASRVDELANRDITRPEGFILPDAPGYEKLIELDKIIAQSLGVKGRSSVRVKKIYQDLIDNFGDELSILRKAELVKITDVAGNHLAQGIGRMRAGEVDIKPGFDGQYGEIRVFTDFTNKKKSI